jgi:uncharacterized protein YbjT (DUF2867 family)
MTTVVVLGASGMLGHALVAELKDHDIRALTRAEADLTDRAMLEESIPQGAVVINTAALTELPTRLTPKTAPAIHNLCMERQKRGVRSTCRRHFQTRELLPEPPGSMDFPDLTLPRRFSR